MCTSITATAGNLLNFLRRLPAAPCPNEFCIGSHVLQEDLLPLRFGFTEKFIRFNCLLVVITCRKTYQNPQEVDS